MNHRILFFLIALTVSACGRPDVPQVAAADTVYTNAAIYTVGPAAGWTNAMAVTDGKISALGSAEEMVKFVGDATISKQVRQNMRASTVQLACLSIIITTIKRQAALRS